MLTITKKLDMSPHGVPQVIRVSQYDSDFTLEFKLFASGGNFAISTGTTAEIRGTKQSGTGYSASATLDTSTKVVTVAGAAQMTAVAGMNIFEIVLKKNNKEISSANFCLLVERAALDADTITDESVLKELNAIIESADTATQAAEEAEDAADRAEAAAQTLVIDSTLTKPGQPADAKATGDAIAGLEDDIAQIVPGLSEDAKQALLACFRHVAFLDNDEDYYENLVNALYGEEPTSGTVDISQYVIGNFSGANNRIQYDGTATNRIFPNPMIYKVMSGNVVYTATLNNSNYRVTIGRIKSTAENDSLVTQGVTKIILSSFTERDGSTLPWSENTGSLNTEGYDYIMPIIKRADNGNMTATDLQAIQNAYTLTWRVVENG